MPAQKDVSKVISKLDNRIKKVEKTQKERKPESKFYDSYDITGSSVSSAWTTVDLVSVAQGANEGERIGLDITGKFLDIRGTLNGYDATQYMRILIVAHQNVSTAITDVLEVDNVWSPKKRNSDQKYNILKDFTISCGGTGDNSKKFHFKIPLKGMKISYSGTSATSFTDNRLQIWYCSDSLAVTHPVIYYYSRFIYLDN